jgi:hypothetical protein
MIMSTDRNQLCTNPQNDKLTSAALLRANRQIHAETSNLVYSANTFVFNSIQAVRTFVKYRSAFQLAAITTLVLRIWRGNSLLVSHDNFDQEDLTVLLQLKGLVCIELANTGYVQDDPVLVLKALQEMADMIREYHEDIKILAIGDAEIGRKYVRGKVLGEL